LPTLDDLLVETEGFNLEETDLQADLLVQMRRLLALRLCATYKICRYDLL